jgi:dUTP pyrophosphatase
VDPNRSIVLPTGLRFGIPHGYMLEIKNRSGIAAKRSLIVGACVVDTGYDGEVFVNIHNIGNMQQRIFPYDKIAQAVLIPVAHPRFIERENGHLYDDNICISDRGDGALGSTGDK